MVGDILFVILVMLGLACWVVTFVSFFFLIFIQKKVLRCVKAHDDELYRAVLGWMTDSVIERHGWHKPADIGIWIRLFKYIKVTDTSIYLDERLKNNYIKVANVSFRSLILSLLSILLSIVVYVLGEI